MNQASSDIFNKAPKVHITIECDPTYAQWILALSAPFTSTSANPLSYAALPEALIQLGQLLGLSNEALPFEYWSGLSNDLIDQFVEITGAYQYALSFNERKWKEEFLDRLELIRSKWGEETDTNLFDAIRSVVNLLESRLAGPDQQRVYCERIGTPIYFENWVDSILSGKKITDEDISAAHFNAFDPIRLKDLLKVWRETTKEPNADEIIPF